MAQARPLLIGAALLALALPGHPLAPLSGLPLDLPALGLLVLLAGWWIALPGAPRRAVALAGALLVLGVLKATIWWAAPGYGLDASIRPSSSPAIDTVGQTPRYRGVDLALDFEGDTFPVHFFNDIRAFNFYTPNQPKRDLLPFTATWHGLLVVPADGTTTLTLEANGPATVELGSGQRAAIEQPGRVREATLTAGLPAGLVPIAVSYRRPDEAMPWLRVRSGADDAPLGAPLLVRDGTTAASVAADGWLRPLAYVVDGLLAGVLALAFVGHTRAVARRASPDRVLLGAYVVFATGAVLLGHLPLYGRAVIQSGGNDWLAYESYARDILLNGPLLTEGRPLGQGAPFYYQPLYIYWVALTHLLLGESLFAPLFMNAVLGIAAGVGLYLLTRELFGRAAAVLAVPLFELYRLTVFAPTAGLLLSENLLFPLVPAFLLVLIRLARSGRYGTAAGAGLVLGLAGLARTTPLALLPPALLILLVAWRRLRLGWRAIGGRLAVLVLVCTLT
ncbi:MAG TPA: glycosyltransferase family 39 protein, partial [Nonomuraea sp.]|nr:glycosyltransferase family 39 protein [Nonomuraea sp.]